MDEAQTKKKKDVDAKNYAKYLLEEGTIVEKRELLADLKSKLVLNGNTIHLHA